MADLLFSPDDAGPADDPTSQPKKAKGAVVSTQYTDIINEKTVITVPSKDWKAVLIRAMPILKNFIEQFAYSEEDGKVRYTGEPLEYLIVFRHWPHQKKAGDEAIKIENPGKKIGLDTLTSAIKKREKDRPGFRELMKERLIQETEIIKTNADAKLKKDMHARLEKEISKIDNPGKRKLAVVDSEPNRESWSDYDPYEDDSDDDNIGKGKRSTRVFPENENDSLNQGAEVDKGLGAGSLDRSGVNPDEDSENQLDNPLLYADYLKNFNSENGKKIQVTNGDTTITLETETAKEREQWVQAIKKTVPQIAEQAIVILPARFKAIVNIPDDKYVFRNFDNFPEDITVTFDGNLDDIDASQNVRDIILNIIEKVDDDNWRQEVETYVNSIIPEVNGQSFSDEEPGDEGSGSLDGSGAFADKAQPGENEAPSTEKCNDVANMTQPQREQLKTKLTGELSELTASMEDLLLRKGDLLKKKNDASALAIEKDRQISVLEKNFLNAGLSERYVELEKEMKLARDKMQERLVQAKADFESVQEKIQPQLDGINQQLKSIEELGQDLKQLHITVSELDAELRNEETQEMNLEKARGKLDECIKRINDFDPEKIRKRKLAELDEYQQEAMKQLKIHQEETFKRLQKELERQQKEAFRQLQEQIERKRKRIDAGKDSQDSETQDSSQSVLE